MPRHEDDIQIMLGKLRPKLSELTPQQEQAYKAGYCGLCQSLRQESGRLSTLTLSYELTFLAHLDIAHRGPSPSTQSVGCTAAPWKTVAALTVAPEIGALGLVIAGLKLEDDRRDEGSIKARLGLYWLDPKVAQALKTLESADFPISAFRHYADDQLQVEETLGRLSSAPRLERLRGAAGPSGQFCATVFRWLAKGWSLPLAEAPKWQALGRQLGEALYIVDALDDRLRDAQSGSFNALSGLTASQWPELREELKLRSQAIMALWSELPERSDTWPALTSSLEQLTQRLTRPLDNATELTDGRLRGLRKRQAQAAYCALSYRDGYYCVGTVIEAITGLCWAAGTSNREREMERVHGDLLKKPGQPDAPQELERVPIFVPGNHTCPSCATTPMSCHVIGAAGLFHCAKCAGVWLNGLHLRELRRQKKETRNFNTFPQDSVPPLHPPGTRVCPLHGETLELSREQGVTVEVCPTCQGWYLDAGELGSLL